MEGANMTSTTGGKLPTDREIVMAGIVAAAQYFYPSDYQASCRRLMVANRYQLRQYATRLAARLKEGEGRGSE